MLTVASSRESSAWARWVASTSRSLPGTRCRFSYRRSTLPNWPMSFAAVFSPTPGTPGILSMESPISARRSGICSGVTPIFTFTAASSSTTRSPPRPLVVKTRTRGLTSWSMSLSAVTRTTSTGESRTRSTSVPSTSSASKPGPRAGASAAPRRAAARTESGCAGRPGWTGASPCTRRTSASRKVGPGGSHAATKYSGVSSRRSFQTMVDVPSMTWLGSPFEVER